MNVGMLCFMILTKLIRGPGGGVDSLFDLDICDSISWVAYAALWLVAMILTFLAAIVARNDYAAKTACGYKFTKGDQEMTLKKIITLVLVAFFCAFFAAMSGVGPGLIFNSFLIQLDIHPGVGSATGMYMTLFTTMAATINVIINDKLNIPFFLLFSGLTIVGTIPGLYGQIMIVVKTGGRTQFTVAILFSFLAICLFTVLPLSIIETLRASEDGEDVTAFSPYCE